MLTDSHCHLHDREFFTLEQAEWALMDAYARGVKQIICIGTSPEDSLAAQRFAASNMSISPAELGSTPGSPNGSLAAQSFAASRPSVFWTYGIHPEEADALTDQELASAIDIFRQSASNNTLLELATREPATGELAARELAARESVTRESATRELAPSPHSNSTAPGASISSSSSTLTPPVAIGEIGLDYHYPGYSRERQIRLFERMLQLAQDARLPVSLHIREAFADALAVLNNFPEVHGVVHSFTGSKKELTAALGRGYYIGVNGLATYTTTPLPPLENMLLETDAPFLTPEPKRGTINVPGNVSLVAHYLSLKLGVSEKIIAETTTQNVKNLFGIKPISAAPPGNSRC